MPGAHFLSWASPHIVDFLGTKPLHIAFIPDAVVTLDLKEYAGIVKDLFGKYGHSLTSIHDHTDPQALIKVADVCMVSGGNSFQLLSRLYEMDIVGLIKQRVMKDMKYVGWSAGSNVACPTIMTTNDMPIIQPPSFDALDLIPYQINPHYTEKSIEGHGGESREQRLKEYLEINKDAIVLGMREGCGLLINGEEQRFIGTGGTIFQYDSEPIHFKEEELHL